jgi:plasmid stabilization system protein ParE
MSLLDQAESLARFPDRGSNVRRRPGVKKLVCVPYLIFYRVDDVRRSVDVLRFWHGAQNPRDLRLE